MSAHILVVEDERIVAKDIQRTLQNLGYSVPVTVATGEAAIEKMEEARPDLVLMDIRLRGAMDGIAAANIIRDRWNVPVVYLTAHADPGTLDRAKISEPFGYVLKPYEERDLHTTVEMALYKHNIDRKLRESERWLTITLSSIGDAVIATDQQSQIVFINPVAEFLTGWCSEEAVGRPLADVFRIVNEYSRVLSDDPVNKVLAHGVAVGLANHTILIARDGTERSIDDSAAPIRDQGGDILGVVLIFRDITERRKAENALRRSEQELSDFFENAPVGMHWVAPDGKVLRANQAELEMLGYDREEYVGRHIADFHVDQSVSRNILERLKRGETLREYPAQLRAKDQSIHDVLVNANSLIEEGRFIRGRTFLRDVTELKRAEKAVRESEKQLRQSQTQLRMALEASRTFAWTWDLRSGQQTYSDGAGAILGLPAELHESSAWQLVHSEDVEKVHTAIEKAIAERAAFSVDFRFVRPDNGELLWLQSRGKVECDGDGTPQQAVGTATDITERKRVEEALREREEWLRVTFSQAAIGIAVASLDGRFLEMNPKFSKMLGYSADELKHMVVADITHPDDLAATRDNMHRLLTGECNEYLHEKRHIRKDGSIIWSLANITLIRDAELKPLRFIGAVEDITWRKRAEQELRESEKRYRLVVEGQAEMLCRFQASGKILFVNGAYARTYGTTPEALVGKSFWDLVVPDDRPRVQALLSRLTPDSPQITIENRVTTADGERWTLWTNRALAFDDDGRLVEAQSSGIDITDRKRAEETIRALLRISERLNSTLDVDALLDILVQESIKIVGAESGVSGLRTPEGMVCNKYFHNGQVVPLAYCWPPLHGLPGWLLIHKTPYLANDAPNDKQVVRSLYEQFGVRSALSIPIITAEKEVVGFFEIHNKTNGTGFTPSDQELLQAVSQLAAIALQNAFAYRKLKSAEESLKQADRRKDEFLATLAHELRNPLAPIKNAVEVLKLAGDEDESVAGVRQMMERQLNHLIRLVDDLLDVSRITRDKLELRNQSVELSSILDQAVETCRSLVEERKQKLVLHLPSEPVYLVADAVRLTQVFANLLNNACKYTDAKGNILITAERVDHDVVVTVKDSGMGIAPEMLPCVFEMFTQIASARGQPQGGLGIGLTLVKRLVEMHGGSIQALSDGRGKGSTFVVRLPVHVETPEQCLPDNPLQRDLVGSRILIVDDNRDAARSLALLLKNAGNETDTAHDGAEALELIEKMRPHIALLDIGMPKMNGYDVCREIRQRPWGRDVVLVALTGWGQEEDRRKSVEAGFDGHLVKPVEHQALINMLTELHSNVRAGR